MILTPTESLAHMHSMLDRQVPFVMGTVVSAASGPSRKLGARMWVAQDGFTLGSVGFGQCADRTLRQEALQVLQAQVPRLYNHQQDDPSLEGGLSCQGEISVWLEPVHAFPESWLQAQQVLEQRRSCVLVTPLDGTGHTHLSTDLTDLTDLTVLPPFHRRAARQGNLFLERWDPQIQLHLAGSNAVAQVLRGLALQMGFEVREVTAATDLLNLDPFSALVVTSHNYAEEVEWLRAALCSKAGHLAVLSSEQRAQRLREFLQETGAVDTHRIHGPAGWDLGVSTAPSIALGILAQMTAALQQHPQRSSNLETACW